MFGGYSAGAFPGLTVPFILDLIRHAILPALSIVLVATGGWALSMRGMMVTTQGEDYVTFAEAKGPEPHDLPPLLRPERPPAPGHGLALALGQIGRGAGRGHLRYPGIGTVLFQAIRENDHFLIQGIVFTVIIALGSRR